MTKVGQNGQYAISTTLTPYLSEGVILCQNCVVHSCITFHQIYSMPCQPMDKGPECASLQRLLGENHAISTQVNVRISQKSHNFISQLSLLLQRTRYTQLNACTFASACIQHYRHYISPVLKPRGRSLGTRLGITHDMHSLCKDQVACL